MYFHLHTNWHIRTKRHAQIEEGAYAQAKGDRLWTRDFCSISLLNLLILTGGNMLVSTFPFYLSELGATKVIIGLVASIYYATSLIMRPIAGWWLDHRSRKSIFLAGICSLVALPLLYLMLPVLPLVALLRAFHGFAWAATGTACTTNACDVMPQSRFGEGMGMFGLTNSLAMVIGPAFGLMLWESVGEVPFFLFISSFAGISLFLFFRFDFREVEQHWHRAGRAPLHARLLNLFDKRALPAMSLLFFLCVPGGAVSSFIALYATEAAKGSGGLYFTFQALGTASMRVFAGRYGDRHGEKLLLYIGCLSFLAGILLMVIAQAPTLFYISAFLYGTGYGLTLPTLQTMSLRNVPNQRRGAASSTYLCGFDISYGLGGLIGGALAEAFGYGVMFVSLSVCFIICALIYKLWVSKTPAAFDVYVAMQRKKLQELG